MTDLEKRKQGVTVLTNFYEVGIEVTEEDAAVHTWLRSDENMLQSED